MERRIRPISHAFYRTMLDGIDVNVIDMRGVVALITNRMLPKAALPNATLSSRGTGRGQLFRFWQRLYKGFFDLPPPPRIISIVWWKRPNGVHVIRHDYPCINMERALEAHLPHGISQCVNVCHEQIRVALQQIDGEKIGSAGNAVATVIRHRRVIPSSAVGGRRYAFPPYNFNPASPRSP